ncbi:odorant receptor 43a-like [Coccinella septempunctata]|uniref:odorant receptor 43a-like n=1 Tax=Coccinella septempunctata TaxID=41139 RepID=UPI001D092D38|nr:odorant receptor 43a-like [Coccinella septempunctata]
MLIMIMILLLWLNNWRNFLVHIDRMNTFAFGIPSQCIVLSKKLDYTIPRLFNGVRVLCLFYGFLRVFDNSFCTNTGLTDDDGYVCNLPFPLWYPIRMNTFGRVIFLWICFIAVALFYFPLLFVLTAIPVTSTHLSIYRIRELKRLLHRNTKEGGCNETIKREELIFFIKYHAEISYCVEAMNNDLGYIHLPYRMLLPVLTALHLFKLINQKDPAALFALLPWFMSIIFLCSLGEHLEFERSSLYTEFNDIPWYYMDVKLRKTYHLFMGKLALPMRIKVKPSSEMSNILLSEILKGTYTFLVYLSSR